MTARWVRVEMLSYHCREFVGGSWRIRYAISELIVVESIPVCATGSNPEDNTGGCDVADGSTCQPHEWTRTCSVCPSDMLGARMQNRGYTDHGDQGCTVSSMLIAVVVAISSNLMSAECLHLSLPLGTTRNRNDFPFVIQHQLSSPLYFVRQHPHSHQSWEFDFGPGNEIKHSSRFPKPECKC